MTNKSFLLNYQSWLKYKKKNSNKLTLEIYYNGLNNYKEEKNLQQSSHECNNNILQENVLSQK